MGCCPVYSIPTLVVVEIALVFNLGGMVPQLPLGTSDPSYVYCNPIAFVVAFDKVFYCCYLG